MRSFVVLLLVVIVILVPSLVLADNVNKGDTATVRWSEWVEPITNSNNRTNQPPGYDQATCVLKDGGTVTVVDIDYNHVANLLLASYTIYPAAPWVAIFCTSGVLFFTTEEKFLKMRGKDNQARAAKQGSLKKKEKN